MKILMVLFILHSCGSLVFSQDTSVREQLFAAVDKIYQEARKQEADILAPRNYTKAYENYAKAGEDFKKGRKLDNIRKRLREAEAYFKKALEAVRIAEVTFSSTRAARNDAESAEARRFTQELWGQAESKFIQAAAILEKGNVNDARKKSAEAERIYRQAELEAIKANYLTPAWTLLEKADRLKVEKRAPKTLARARKYANAAEDLLRQNRYDNDEARQLAQQAKYEARHALYLNAQIDNMMSKGYSLEDIFLAFEQPIDKIAGTVGAPSGFERGLDPVVSTIIDSIARTQETLRLARDYIIKNDMEKRNLEAQISSMESRLGNLSEAERSLKRKLEMQRAREDLISQVAKTFSRSEGLVLRSGDNIIVRLYGLTFPVGRSTIEPQYFQLLTKVQNAIRRIPNGSVIIEGHTDSRGSDRANQGLSEERAAAVRQYLLANMVIPENKIASVGYGESKPIASNETAQGRAQNRRIDIVIIPEWATN
jgi:outer membrane protein OmpA-like peptidoglycan-associated protein